VKPPSAVRILAGRWKGRRLDVPRGARPTSGRAREALFDILQDSVVGIRVLDLFAGSGAIGLEALSRGAAEAVFVESDLYALDANLARLAPREREVRVLAKDARRAAADLARAGERFQLVFADPPYARGGSALPRSIGDLVGPGGKLVLQLDSDESPPEIPGLARVSRRAYARNVFWFFEPAGARPLPRVRPEW
jgi:16S rRNA (guanine966-N2)-methyltransferase